MSISVKKHSISRDCFIIFSIIILIAGLLSAGYIWSVYNSREKIKAQILQKQTTRIERELVTSFDYVSHLMKFLGEQIIKNDSIDPHKIAELLRSKLITNDVARKQYSWAMFDWDNPQNEMMVSTMYGVMQEPKSVAHRYFAKMAPKEPWKLHFDSPDIGISSGEWVIPAGMGVTNDKGEFVGMLSMAFNIAKFNQKIENTISDKGINFIILDANNTIALHSFDEKLQTVNKDFFKNALAENELPATGAGFLDKNVHYGNATYSYYSKLDGYPYTILIGYNNIIATKDFYETLVPGLIGIAVFATITFLLLFLFRYIIVKPVIRLSRTVDRMAAGEIVDNIRGCKTYEINNLAQQLLRVNHLIKSEKEARENLEEAIQIAKASDNEKEEFLKDMCTTLRKPLNIIFEGVEAIRCYKLGSNLDSYDTQLHIILDAVKQLRTYTTDNIYPTDVNVQEVIEKSLIIQKKRASENSLTLTTDIQSSIPPIFADRLRIQQILLSVLHEAISYTPPQGNIHLMAAIEPASAQLPQILVIKIQDNGMGLDEEGRNDYLELVHKHASDSNQITDSSQLSLQIIKHLVKLHKGSFTLEAKRGEGSTFTICFPYLKKTELITNAGRLDTYDAPNVVSFNKKKPD